ncbi:hypothetical protein AZH53_09990 [Methanomicrobiaceae archaeon CYW5]|uniref:Fic family protein n=1 Tax=Methanovulcanius yangii TaxID=1789227 RepID=UPI0029CA838D|nr:Fic family protein [Methanovulcanius yangii]MBT8508735.1 hypothetical protein [Methanovulcanius yangii]
MRTPEKPPDANALYAHYGEKFSNFFLAYTTGDEEITEAVKRYNEARYIHWDDLKRQPLPFEPKLFWLLLKYIRNYGAAAIDIGDESFKFMMLGKFQRELHLIDKASPAPLDALIGERPSEANKRQYLANSIMEEAIASSQLEGAATTRQVAKKFLREGTAPKNTSERMILNNYQTIRTLKDLKEEPLTPELILTIHRMITEGTLESREDEVHLRTSNDILVRDKVDYGKIYHVPPDCTKIPAMLDDLCRLANDDEIFVHPIVKGIILHFLVGYIHPFNDGNGRTARAIFYWYVLKHGYGLFEYLSISRIFVTAPAKYTKAYLYTETDENDMTYFIDYNITIISRAMEELRQYIEETRAEQRNAITLLEEMPEISFRQAEILKDFIRHPDRPYTISEIAGKYKISLPTARSDLLGLVEMGQLRKIRDGKRWVFLLERGAV